MSIMTDNLVLDLGLFQLTITGWKILGFAGALCFASRWFVQAWYRKRYHTREMPTRFWVISLVGAGLVTAYFIWGKNDSIGILTNSLPACVAAYNLWQDIRWKRAKRQDMAAAATDTAPPPA